MIKLKFFKSYLVSSIVVYGGAVLIFAGAIWLTFQYVKPLPPKKVTIATGSKNGAYYKYARKYAEIFAREGVKLEIIQTSGSIDNLAHMSTSENKVDAAFMQGGITTAKEHPKLRSLGSLYYEPLWVFYNDKHDIENLSDVKGLKADIGPPNSGTNYLIKELLKDNGVTLENTTLLERNYDIAVPQLVSGESDIMGIITGVRSKIIENLSEPTGKVHLFSFERAEAYARSHHYLQRVTLPQGAINLAENLPRKDIFMIAPTANLVVNEDLHPAIKYLFLLAANQVHMEGDLFAQPGQFPNDTALLFPISDEAESFYKNGPPLLMRFLPYQLAVIFERLKILLIPLLTLLYPLFKFTPPAYRWQIRRRIFRWYKQLKELDMEAYDIISLDKAEVMFAQLEELDRQVMETSVPLSYTDYIYSLRIHIRLIQTRLEKRCMPDEMVDFMDS